MDNYGTHKHARVPTLADETSPLSFAFHPDGLLVAEPGGAVVCGNHAQADSARKFPQRGGIGRGDRIPRLRDELRKFWRKSAIVKLRLLHNTSNGRLRFAITTTGTTGERIVDAPTMLPSNVWTHVAVMLNGQQAVLYVNGRAVAVNNSFYLLPTDVLGAANYIGRSKFGSDPYFRGQIDSVLIASSPLPIEQIAASPLSIVRAGESVTLSWPAFETGLVINTATNLGLEAVWTQLTNAPLTTNGIRFLSVPAVDPNRFFRLTWP